jgi:hypothetical protein
MESGLESDGIVRAFFCDILAFYTPSSLFMESGLESGGIDRTFFCDILAFYTPSSLFMESGLESDGIVRAFFCDIPAFVGSHLRLPAKRLEVSITCTSNFVDINFFQKSCGR